MSVISRTNWDKEFMHIRTLNDLAHAIVCGTVDSESTLKSSGTLLSQISSVTAIGNDSCPSRAVRLSPDPSSFPSNLFIFLHDRSSRTGGYDDAPRLILVTNFVSLDWSGSVLSSPFLLFYVRTGGVGMLI
ncbi:hypothetical protein PoB_001897300 [Plakobranchus ocellatus]|uniref:Uncharacterized protein n=1 Tax=Plakobranchus ocellatus TaxID=259542 RepID=A0AAV3ZDE4_9GAST|nr:hypothetical protein PoB_001897300 [Plakobranchus ocellatus]